MKNLIIFCSVLTLLSGCSSQPAQDRKILAKINNYEITQAEFEQDFKESPYSRSDTSESRQEFLNQLITRKLILQDAQVRGLDKEKDFLKMIERFWEQSLLRMVLEKRTMEITGSSLVTDKMIEEAYKKIVSEGKTEKSYNQMYSQIKWELTKAQEAMLMNNWLESLHKKADIRVNQELLKRNK